MGGWEQGWWRRLTTRWRRAGLRGAAGGGVATSAPNGSGRMGWREMPMVVRMTPWWALELRAASLAALGVGERERLGGRRDVLSDEAASCFSPRARREKAGRVSRTR